MDRRDIADLERAIEVLGIDLNEARVIHRFDGFEEPEYLAALAALNACIKFINGVDPWRDAELAVPLSLLSLALGDLENGKVAPMLKPKEVSHRPASMREATFRGYAAGIIGGLMLPGPGRLKRRDAEEWLAKRLSAAGYSTVSGAKLRGWRKEAMEEPASQCGQRYAAVLREDWTDRIARAEKLATKLISIPPPW